MNRERRDLRTYGVCDVRLVLMAGNFYILFEPSIGMTPGFCKATDTMVQITKDQAEQLEYDLLIKIEKV